jgi:sortase B
VYGTNIDYPVTQGQDNMKYVNTNAEGLYSLSGSIFLDCCNNKDFSDFNNILYGHHMAKKAMFGDIGDFRNQDMFDTHRYGNLYFDGKDHGIEFFTFVHTDAYDNTVFTAAVQEEDRQAYLDYLVTKAIHERDIGVTTLDHIILLSTCSSSSTNGRDILIGRITDEVFDDPFIKTEKNSRKKQINIWDSFVKEIYLWPVLLTLIVVLHTVRIIMIYYRHGKRRQRI